MVSAFGRSSIIDAMPFTANNFCSVLVANVFCGKYKFMKERGAIYEFSSESSGVCIIM